MIKEKFNEVFNRISVLYMSKPKEETMKEYYLSRLGNIEGYELDKIFNFLKENRIKPPFGAIPQLYQLLEIYDDEILPKKLYKRRKQAYREHKTCELCDDTGFVPMRDRETRLESVCGCTCQKGTSIIKNAKERMVEKTPDPAHIMSYENVNLSEHELINENLKAPPMQDGELADILMGILIKIKKDSADAVPF